MAGAARAGDKQAGRAGRPTAATAYGARSVGNTGNDLRDRDRELVLIWLTSAYLSPRKNASSTPAGDPFTISM
jgi:hypothetical protein